MCSERIRFWSWRVYNAPMLPACLPTNECSEAFIRGVLVDRILAAVFYFFVMARIFSCVELLVYLSSSDFSRFVCVSVWVLRQVLHLNLLLNKNVLDYDAQDNAKEESVSVWDIDRSGVAAGRPAVPFDRRCNK